MLSLLGRSVRLCDGISRREVLRIGGLGFTGLMWSHWLQARAAAAEKARTGQPPGPEIALNKLALSDNMAALAEFVTSVLGPRLIADTGEWGTYAWTSVVLGAPGYRLGGGSDEVLKNMIAERVLGLPKPS